MKVVIKCKGSRLANLDDLKPLQGDLKDLSEENYEKLKTEILDLGFSAPFFVWKSQGEENLLDGHQRCKTLIQMRDEDEIDMPAKFPVVDVEADNYVQAKKKVLAISSQYGRMTRSGLEGFMEDVDFDMEEVAERFSFDAINVNAIVEKLEPGDDSNRNKEIDTDNFGNDLEHTCPKCGFEFND